MSRDYPSPYLPSLSFTDADLQANREGRLTAQQETLVDSVYQTRQKGARQTVIGFLVFFPVLIVVGGIIEFNKSGKGLPDFIASMGGTFLAIAALLFVLVGIGIVSTWYISRDAKAHHLRSVEGIAHPLVAEAHYRGSRYMRYELRLKKGSMTRKLFRFPNERSVRLFTEGKSYRVYYIGFYPFDIVLSAEEI